MSEFLKYFGQPWYLALLLLLPGLWVLSYRGLSGLGFWRRIAALVLRSGVVAAIILALAEFRAAEEARAKPLDPTLPLRLATERLRVERTFAALEHDGGWLALAGGREGDLVLAGLKAMFGWLGGRRG